MAHQSAYIYNDAILTQLALFALAYNNYLTAGKIHHGAFPFNLKIVVTG